MRSDSRSRRRAPPIRRQCDSMNGSSCHPCSASRVPVLRCARPLLLRDRRRDSTLLHCTHGGCMKTTLVLLGGVALLSITALAQAPRSAPANVKDIVELELLTHTEVYDKIHNEGMTSVLIVTGGTEERGPHDVLGGHTIMARHHAVEMAKKLWKTLVAPVMPIAVQATGLRENTDQPGAIQMPPDVFKAVQIAEIES